MMMRDLSPWNSPFNFLDSFRRDMDAIVNRFFGAWEQDWPPWPQLSGWYSPRTESYVEGNTLYIKADLPGVDPKDVELTVEGRQLTIKGERKSQHEAKETEYLRREVQYGSFVRTFLLPEGVKADDLYASYQNGVLQISVPLPASMAAKKIPIETAHEEPKRLAA